MASVFLQRLSLRTISCHRCSFFLRPDKLFPQSLLRTFSSGRDETVIPQTHVTDHDFEISEDEFKSLSEMYLTGLAEHLEDLGSQGTIETDDFDVNFSGDVLTVETGVKNMKYVINRQTPNRQIWLSSPVSGPYRYDFIEKRWVYKRTGEKMSILLDREFQQMYGNNCDFEQFEDNFFAHH